MEVKLCVPYGADVSVIEEEYPDLVLDFEDEEEGYADYFIGKDDDDEDDDGPWLTQEEAVEFCGFCEGAVPGAVTLISGKGFWAQGMLAREDFSTLAIQPEERERYERESHLWHAAFERGERHKGEKR